MQTAAKPPIEEIYCQLIPLRQLRLIVPRTCVAEVVRYTAPERPSAGSSGWFRGFFGWNNLRIPLLSFEDLCGRQAAEPGGRTRIAIFSSLTGKLDSGYYGVMTEGFPQLVRVNREVMRLDERQAWPADGPVICQIRMINEYPLIPDLERVEELLHGQIDRGAQRLN
jgi:chemosensory pili system protein ChpC